MAVAGERLLDAVGGILFDLRPAPPRHQHNYAARVAHEDGRARMGIVRIKLLDGADVGIEFVEQSAKFGLQFYETIGDRLRGRKTYHPAIHERRP